MPERPPDISTDDASEVCIIGGGIGGLALAVGLQSRGVRCHVVERDSGWDERRRGYGLTLGPTCMTALTSLGLLERVRAVDQACPSDWHWVFAASGAILGYFGIAFSGKPGEARNFRVPRHELRRMLYEQLAPGTVRWGLRLESYVEVAGGVEVHLKPSLQRSSAGDGGGAAGGGTTGGGAAGGAAASKARLRCSVLVGADGVRSAVRAQKFGDALRYVGVVVVLGVCRTQHPLLRRGGFYTVDGTHRLFTMPYEPLEAAEEEEEAEAEAEEDGGAGRERAAGGRHSTMWQLSLAMPDEAAARALCGGGGEALLREVVRRCSSWHAPVGEMLAETAAGSVWGTPLCDRAPMPHRSKQAGRARGGGAQAGEAQPSPWASRVTLLGDAAHAMTPVRREKRVGDGDGEEGELTAACSPPAVQGPGRQPDARRRGAARQPPRGRPRGPRRGGHCLGAGAVRARDVRQGGAKGGRLAPRRAPLPLGGRAGAGVVRRERRARRGGGGPARRAVPARRHGERRGSAGGASRGRVE